ncbi:hypothetical protein EGW08_022679, partial [Elysia chlorotica]
QIEPCLLYDAYKYYGLVFLVAILTHVITIYTVVHDWRSGDWIVLSEGAAERSWKKTFFFPIRFTPSSKMIMDWLIGPLLDWIFGPSENQTLNLFLHDERQPISPENPNARRPCLPWDDAKAFLAVFFFLH